MSFQINTDQQRIEALAELKQQEIGRMPHTAEHQQLVWEISFQLHMVL